MSLVQLGTEVTMAFPEARLMERIAAPEFSDLLEAMYRERGVRILTGTTAERLEGDGQVERAVLDNGETLYVDLVVMGAGIRLNTGLAQEAGLAISEDSAVLVDEYLCTSDPNIYAAGDIAAWPDQVFGKRLRVEHWDVAQNQGTRAGRNMAGDEEPYTVLPYFFSDLFDLALEVWGNLESWDQTVLRGSLQEGSYAFYYFDGGKLAGVLAVGRPDEERGPMQSLIKERAPYDQVAQKLKDEKADLDTLLK
jgi:3-phenylpropionate/trans-cinnamate dioxygenase ferredoxin reductase component